MWWGLWQGPERRFVSVGERLSLCPRGCWPHGLAAQNPASEVFAGAGTAQGLGPAPQRGQMLSPSFPCCSCPMVKDSMSISLNASAWLETFLYVGLETPSSQMCCTFKGEVQVWAHYSS